MQQTTTPLNWEDVEATYVDTDIIASPLVFKRVKYREDKRVYEDQNERRYLSLTSFIAATTPESTFLKSWREKMISELGTSEKVREYVQATANYGTALHILIGDYAKASELNMLDLEDKARALLQANGFSPTSDYFGMAVEDLLSDFASLAVFLYEYKAEVVAVELPVGDASLMLATQIDLVAYLHFPEKRGKEGGRFLTAINFKSGRSSGKYDGHAMQLALEAHLFHQTYGNALGLTIEKVANVSPKEWQKSPTYNFIEHTDWSETLEFALTIHKAYVSHPTKCAAIFDFTRTQFNIMAGTLKVGDNPADFFNKVKA